jgi:hypothetical protein
MANLTVLTATFFLLSIPIYHIMRYIERRLFR